MDQKNRPIPKIPESLKCFIHNPAYMQQSIMRALRCRKTLPRTPLFSLAVYVFISNQQLEFEIALFKALKKFTRSARFLRP